MSGLDLSLNSKEREINVVGQNLVSVLNSSKVEILNLSKNKIQSLPTNLRKLKILILSHNSIQNIQTFRSSFLSYSNLTVLDLSHNQIKDMGDILEYMPNLIRLILLDNKLSSIKIEKSKLQSLDLAMNRFKIIPDCPDTLIALNLDRNQLTNVDFSKPFGKLLKLCLSSNEIGVFHTQVDNPLPELLCLDISGNKLTGLHNLTKMIPKLKLIDISSNRLPAMPKSLPRSVEEINAANNKLRSLPDYLSDLSQLKIADFSHNSIKEISISLPESLKSLLLVDNSIETTTVSKLPVLFKLCMMQNNLTELPVFTGNYIYEYYFSRNHIQKLDISVLSKTTTRIDLSHNELDSIPDELFTLPNLTHLFLNFNRIKSLPDAFSKSQSLLVIALNSNPIETLPNEYPQNLEQLYMQNCNLDKIPESLTTLDDLIELDCSCNAIKEIPAGFKAIKKLYLSQNTFIQFPINIPENIEYIDLSMNYITVLPEKLVYKDLKTLDLSHNELLAFPKEFDFPSLETLRLQSNPIMSLLKLENFPSLTTLDISTTSASFNDTTSGKVYLTTSELSLLTDTMNRANILSGKADYALMRGYRELKDDCIIIRSDFMRGVNLFALIDARGGSKSSVIIYRRIITEYTEEDDIFTEENVKKIHYRMSDYIMKAQYLTINDYGIALTYNNEMITLCTGKISMLVFGKQIREIVSEELNGKPHDISTLNKTHGAVPTYYGNGNTLIYHKIPPLSIIKKPILPDDNWLLILSASVRDCMTIEEIKNIVSKYSSSATIASAIKNATYENMSSDNISVICIDLRAVRV